MSGSDWREWLAVVAATYEVTGEWPSDENLGWLLRGFRLLAEAVEAREERKEAALSYNAARETAKVEHDVRDRAFFQNNAARYNDNKAHRIALDFLRGVGRE